MTVFTAHLHARRPPVLVPEAFSWGGFLFGPLWLLRHGAWVGGAIVLAVLLALCTLAPPALRPLLAFTLFAVTGLFGQDARRAELGLRRFRLAHVVTGRTEDDAFVRLLAAHPGLAHPRLAGAAA